MLPWVIQSSQPQKSTTKMALPSRKKETPTTSCANEDEISSADIENITGIIREFVKEELDSHEKNIKDSNYKLKCLDMVSTETAELYSSLEFTQKNNDQKMKNIRQKLTNLEKQMLIGFKMIFWI